MKTHNFKIANLDTDSISFSKEDGSAFSEEEQTNLLLELNSNFPEKIKWEHDGIYDVFCILKAKNYITYQKGKIKTKGSSLKSSKIEPRLKDFMKEIIDCLIFDKTDQLVSIYHKYVYEVHNLKDISGWCGKKTITHSVINPERTNEQKILDALNGQPVQMGDKYYFYYAETKSLEQVPRYRTDKITKEKIVVGYVEKEVIDYPLALRESWNSSNPNHSVITLLKKLHKTLIIFKNVIDIEQFTKFHLKSKEIKQKLDNILQSLL